MAQSDQVRLLRVASRWTSSRKWRLGWPKNISGAKQKEQPDEQCQIIVVLFLK